MGKVTYDKLHADLYLHDHKEVLPRTFVSGSFTESFNALATSDGAIVTMTLTNAVSGNLTMQFTGGLMALDCTSSPCTIALTVGSDSSPQSNYIYIPESTKVLTKSTSGFPTRACARPTLCLYPFERFLQSRFLI